MLMKPLELNVINRERHSLRAFLADVPYFGHYAHERRRISKVLCSRTRAEFDESWRGAPADALKLRDSLIDIIRKDRLWGAYHFFPCDQFRAMYFESSTSLRAVDWMFSISKLIGRDLEPSDEFIFSSEISFIDAIRHLLTPAAR
jgi:hypothetical protein